MPDRSEQFIERLQELMNHGFQNAAKGFSGMIGTRISIIEPSVRSIEFQEIPEILGGAEQDAVGIYLRVEGEISGQVMLLFPLGKALEIVDLLFEEEIGTTKQLGSLERSSLAEVGNLMCAFFLNAVYEVTKISSRPTPPAVMVDMVGAILDVIIATMGEIEQNVLMFTTTFEIGQRQTPVNFWIVPDPESLKKMVSSGLKNE